MTTAQKTITSVILAAVIALAIIGGYYFPKYQILASASPTGSTFGDAKFAGVVVSLATPGANGTSTSILNTDTSDRYVTSTKVGCENIGTSRTAYTGTGLASLQVSIGTTTSANPASFLSFAAITTGTIIGTSSVNNLFSSSTLQTATTSLSVIWPANTNMTFYFNATNTAVCTVGVDYIGS